MEKQTSLCGVCIFWVLAAAFSLLVAGCRSTPPASPLVGASGGELSEATGESFLISALEEVEFIGEIGQAGSTPLGLKTVIRAVAADTVYSYGEVTPEGYGAVVTERHAYPKGILLITVRKTYGKAQGGMVTQTKRYISYAEFQADSAQQSTITEVSGLSADTILTHVNRNGTVETYTFRLPVVTRTVNPQDGSVRVTSRYGANGAVYSEVRDGDGNLVQVRRSNGEPDGSVTNYIEYPDGSWRNTRTIGRADGSVFREITSGS